MIKTAVRSPFSGDTQGCFLYSLHNTHEIITRNIFSHTRKQIHALLAVATEVVNADLPLPLLQ